MPSIIDDVEPGWRDHPIESLKHAAMYDSADVFMQIANLVITPGKEYLYQEMAQVAATTGNLPIIEAIEKRYMLDYDVIATIARSSGYHGVAGWLTGNEFVVPQYDAPTTEDLEDDRSLVAESWQNQGWTLIHNDEPIEPMDLSRKREIMGSRQWGGRDEKLPYVSPDVEWEDIP